MPLDTKTLADAFERDNVALADEARGLMTHIVADRSLHARFINTLATLEHLGSHSDKTARHGFFKRHAEQEAGRAMAEHTGDLLAPRAARNYFKRLEASIIRAVPHVEHKGAHDLAMAIVVHFRAGWTHRHYHRALARAGHALPLHELPGDDHGHLAGLAEQLHAIAALDESHIRHLCEIESRLYHRLLGAFINATATMPSSVETGLTVLGRMMQ